MSLLVPFIPLVLLTVAAVYDFRTRIVPDGVSSTMLLGGIVATSQGYGPATWQGWAISTALACTIGLLLFARGGWGGADVKLLVALGGWLPPAALLATLFWMAIVGAVLAIAYATRGRKSLPYVPAIAAGLLIQFAWPDALGLFIQSTR